MLVKDDVLYSGSGTLHCPDQPSAWVRPSLRARACVWGMLSQPQLRPPPAPLTPVPIALRDAVQSRAQGPGEGPGQEAGAQSRPGDRRAGDKWAGERVPGWEVGCERRAHWGQGASRSRAGTRTQGPDAQQQAPPRPREEVTWAGDARAGFGQETRGRNQQGPQTPRAGLCPGSARGVVESGDAEPPPTSRPRVFSASVTRSPGRRWAPGTTRFDWRLCSRLLSPCKRPWLAPLRTGRAWPPRAGSGRQRGRWWGGGEQMQFE